MFSSEFLLKGVAAPFLTAFATILLSSRLFSGRRGMAAAGFAIAQALGAGWLLWGQDVWLPSRNLHWVPWCAVGGALLGPVLVAGGLARFERWLLAAFAALATAALLVPTWPDLWPSRTVSMMSFTAALTVLARGVDGVGRRNPPRLVSLSMAATALVAAMLIAACVSLKLGESALVTAAALAGSAAAVLIRPDETAVRGLALPYALAVGGWCYVCAIELPSPTPPLVALLFVPLAPLMLALVAAGPLANRSLTTRWIAGLLLVAGYLVGVGAWAWTSTETSDDEYGYSMSYNAD
ncbi:hypothetical protein Pan44_22030 [Caulifigura coniformis]|uniref:Uncharacterized protein n=1 Tax=Caulifigura coniformis TaxID=2527983 RepID=A0A517SDI5_9PLAN|nr:hypothetical protein Pan44_22030 [Caulifigura coniformis]